MWTTDCGGNQASLSDSSGGGSQAEPFEAAADSAAWEGGGSALTTTAKVITQGPLRYAVHPGTRELATGLRDQNGVVVISQSQH